MKYVSKAPSKSLLGNDEEEVRYLRPSSIAAFIRCPYQWYNIHILGRRQRPAAASSAGTALHEAAEHGFIELMKSGNLAPKDACMDVARDSWHKINFGDEDTDGQKKVGEMVYRQGESYGQYLDDIVEGVEVLYDEYMTDCVIHERIPTAVEKRYSVRIDHPFFTHVSGSLDVEFGADVEDYKFTKRKTNPSHYLLQQNTYSWLRRMAEGVQTDNRYLRNVVRGKGVLHTLVVDNKEKYAEFWMEQVLDTVEKFVESGDEEIFMGCSPDSNYLCSEQWCGFWHECPYVAGLRELPEETLDIQL